MASFYIPEHLQCPTCFEKPRGSVFQCPEGHTVCKICFPTLQVCPQCKIPFAGRPIRNRVMETMFEEYKCPYKSSGCTAFIDTRFLQDHLNVCMYNEAKFGKLKNICHKFGFLDCSFKMNNGNVVEGLEHFSTSHTIIPVVGGSILLEFTDIDKLSGVGYSPTQTSPPLIWHVEKERCVVIIKVVVSNEIDEKYSMSFSPSYFRYDCDVARKLIIEIYMGNVKDESRHDMFGSLSPSNLLEEGTSSIQSKHSFLFNRGKVPQNAFVGIKLKSEIPCRLETSSNATAGRDWKPVVLSATLFITLKDKLCPSIHQEPAKFNVICDSCNLCPLIGCFYKCLHCAEFDLCVNCITARSFHSEHIFAVMKTEKQYSFYRSKCTPEGQIRATHSMFNAPGAAQPENVTRSTNLSEGFNAQCDGCGVLRIKNKRYICLVCLTVDCCQKCFDADIHGHHIFGLASNSFQ